MSAALRAATAYFAVVFALGFILGAFRVLVSAPAVGEVWATLLELPFILGASWVACGWAVRAFAVPRDISVRIAMGATAFAFTIAAETLLGVYGFGRALEQQAAAFAQPGGLAGIAAQLIFAAFPAIRR